MLKNAFAAVRRAQQIVMLFDLSIALQISLMLLFSSLAEATFGFSYVVPRKCLHGIL